MPRVRITSTLALLAGLATANVLNSVPCSDNTTSTTAITTTTTNRPSTTLTWSVTEDCHSTSNGAISSVVQDSTEPTTLIGMIGVTVPTTSSATSTVMVAPYTNATRISVQTINATSRCDFATSSETGPAEPLMGSDTAAAATTTTTAATTTTTSSTFGTSIGGALPVTKSSKAATATVETCPSWSAGASSSSLSTVVVAGTTGTTNTTSSNDDDNGGQKVTSTTPSASAETASTGNGSSLAGTTTTATDNGQEESSSSSSSSSHSGVVVKTLTSTITNAPAVATGMAGSSGAIAINLQAGGVGLGACLVGLLLFAVAVPVVI